MKRFLILLLIFNIDICLAGDGGYAGAYLRMGLGARPKALGGEFVAIADDSYAAYYNPAGLPFLKDKHHTASVMFLSLDRSFNYMSFSQHLKPTAGFSFGWINAGVGNIEERNSEGIRIGTIENSENAFCFSFAQIINKYISIGITGKVLYYKLYNITAKGFGFDGGILIKPVKNLNFGFLIKDINARYSWNTSDIYERGTVTEDKFPSVFRGGTSYYVEKYKLLLALDIEKNQKSDSYIHAGIETVWQKRFSLRGGIN